MLGFLLKKWVEKLLVLQLRNQSYFLVLSITIPLPPLSVSMPCNDHNKLPWKLS